MKLEKIANHIFALTVFSGSFLLFLIQPMITKQILPIFGGGQYVWLASMLLFQTLLLFGYIYAHLIATYIPAKITGVLHLILLLLSTLLLPIAVDKTFDVSTAGDEVFAVIKILALAIGAQFFLLSANVPTVQKWLALFNQKKNTYHLFIASNLGSFGGLLSYPFLVEPNFDMYSQVKFWATFYYFYIFLIGASSAFIFFVKQNKSKKKVLANKTAAKEKLRWVLLAFIPSSLMLGLTSYVTTDIAAAPLLWVIPLAVYLFSFVLAFSKIGEKLFPNMQTGMLNLIIFLVTFSLIQVVFLPLYLIHVICFFAIATVCHTLLYKARPGNENLTEFYLYISFGGLLGGLFNAVIAPNIFTSNYEYFLIMVAAVLVLKDEKIKNFSQRNLVIIFTLATTLLAIFAYDSFASEEAIIKILSKYLSSFTSDKNKAAILSAQIFTAIIFIITIFLCQLTRQNKKVLASVLLSILLIGALGGKEYIFKERNYYGVSRVFESDGKMVFMHGTTLHGFQTKDENRLKPTGYYVPLINAYKILNNRFDEFDVAVIGLGVGVNACIANKDQRMVFYEIDENVKKIAEDKNLFTYLSDCPARSEVVMGDGRLKISKHEGKFGLIVADAFSSDSVPTHLLTMEALKIYESKLKEGGIIAFNISNRYVVMEEIIAAAGEKLGFKSFLGVHKATNPLELSSKWIFLTKNANEINELVNKKEWHEMKMADNVKPWMDNYSGIFQVLKF